MKPPKIILDCGGNHAPETGSFSPSGEKVRMRGQRQQNTAASARKIHELYEIPQRLFPLPAGEGQGEGERGVYLQPYF